MPKFSLSPTSGYPNSYYDIQFTVETETIASKIYILNKTAGQFLNILGVSSGSIQNENLIIPKNKQTQGYINLFNGDKMNTGLEKYQSVEIACLIDGKEESNVVFYNEGKSLDSDILPFSLFVDKPIVDIEKHEPLKMRFACNAEKKYELCIRNPEIQEDSTFEVVTKRGITEIEIPSEVLYHDLNLENNFAKIFKINYVQFEGIDYDGFLNRKYIPINIDIRFQNPQQSPLPQNKPNWMNEEFIISDRYWVHTHKQFSGFGEIEHDPKKSTNMSRLLFEAIDMKAPKLKTQQNTAENVHHEIKQAAYKQIAVPRTNSKPFLNVYNAQKQSQQIGTFSVPTPKKDCGCSRKK